MKYVVVWNGAAEAMLAQLWLDRTDHIVLTRISNELDRELERSPLRTGVAMESSVHRLAHAPPLAIEFYVVEDDKKVIVNAVFAS